MCKSIEFLKCLLSSSQVCKMFLLGLTKNFVNSNDENELDHEFSLNENESNNEFAINEIKLAKLEHFPYSNLRKGSKETTKGKVTLSRQPIRFQISDNCSIRRFNKTYR